MDSLGFESVEEALYGSVARQLPLRLVEGVMLAAARIWRGFGGVLDETGLRALPLESHG